LPGIEDGYNIPYTLAYAIRTQEQIDSFYELPKEKRPPKNIWHNEYKINEWYEEVVFSDRDSSKDYLEFDLSEVD
jgi:hypothetical protein